MNKIPKNVLLKFPQLEKISIQKQYIIIENNQKKYIYKKAISKDVNRYLKKIDFSNYYQKINDEEEFDICIIEEYQNNRCDTICTLHSKSKEEEDYSIEEIEKIYQKIRNEYDIKFQNYFNWQDRIEEKRFPLQEEYNLLINISKIYQMLSIGRFFLEEWKRNNPKESIQILWIDDISKDNFLNGIIIQIEQIKKDNFVYFLANYYIEYHQQNDIKEEIEKLVKNIDLKKNEILLFYSLISISFDKSNKEMNQILEYVEKTYSILLEEYKEYQKRKEEMLEQ